MGGAPRASRADAFPARPGFATQADCDECWLPVNRSVTREWRCWPGLDEAGQPFLALVHSTCLTAWRTRCLQRWVKGQPR